METPIETSLKLVLRQSSKKAEESYAILSNLPLHELFLMYHRPGNLSQTFIYSAVAFELSVVQNKKIKTPYFSVQTVHSIFCWEMKRILY